jgi:CRISPR/Cas system Type II protein with McrA/HNH and RuvC-like nuclease domain
MKTKRASEKPEHAAKPCLSDWPYRALVFKELNQHGVPLYLVAGCENPASKANKALRIAFKQHGGECFYCKGAIAADDFTIDHVEPLAKSAGEMLQNLVIAHKNCNQSKGQKPIEAFSPDAGKEWLTALLQQVQDRLNRL